MTSTAIIDPKGAMSAEQRREMVLARVKALKEGGQTYVPYEGGVNYLRFNGNTGQMNYGRDDREVPKGQRFAVPLDGVMHGVEEWFDSKKLNENKRKYLEGPAPSAPSGAKMAGGGDRNGWSAVIDVRIQGVGGEMDKVVLEVGCNNQSKLQEAENLIGAMSDMCDTPQGQEGFFNAIVELEPKSYRNKRFNKDIFWPGFKIVGWTDGYSIRELSASDQGAIGSIPSDMLD